VKQEMKLKPSRYRLAGFFKSKCGVFLQMDDTIAAISTPVGEGGIGIVRLSGAQAVSILERIFNSKSGKPASAFNSHMLVYGHIVDPKTKTTVDEVLVSAMYAPFTYTRENVVEINCHGGIASLKNILEIVLNEGARLAEPGEFTKRAFLNGRIDLAQAEAVFDIITARTEQGLQLAVEQLKGKLSTKVDNLQQRLLGILAHMEAVIDFPEEDIADLDAESLISQLEQISGGIDEISKGSGGGRIYREGISVAIAGKPNVGKSSLLNALLKEKRAIVTDVPGTTRDIIEETINIRGIPVRLIDMAGMRESKNEVEVIGVMKAKETLDDTDLILLVLDAASGLEKEDRETICLIRNKKVLVIINKIDLKTDRISRERLKELLGDKAILLVSALKEEGIGEIENAIFNMVMGGEVVGSRDIFVTNMRHGKALTKARQHLTDAALVLESGYPVDLAVLDIREAWEDLGEITGSTIHEDIVDKIFADFCVGK